MRLCVCFFFLIYNTWWERSSLDYLLSLISLLEHFIFFLLTSVEHSVTKFLETSVLSYLWQLWFLWNIADVLANSSQMDALPQQVCSFFQFVMDIDYLIILNVLQFLSYSLISLTLSLGKSIESKNVVVCNTRSNSFFFYFLVYL